MTGPSYPPARAVASRVHAHLASQILVARERGEADLAPEADVDAVEAIIDAAFWASLRREEGYTPTISLAFLPPDRAFRPLAFEPRLPLAPDALARLAPAVKRPGIHLGVWREVPGKDGLRVWGTTRMLPPLCFVLEVIAPGLLVVKYPHGTSGKFVNIVVLEGDQVKVVDERGASVPDCPGIEAIVTTLLGFDSTASWAGADQRVRASRGVDANARPRRCAARRAGRFGRVAAIDRAAAFGTRCSRRSRRSRI